MHIDADYIFGHWKSTFQIKKVECVCNTTEHKIYCWTIERDKAVAIVAHQFATVNPADDFSGSAAKLRDSSFGPLPLHLREQEHKLLMFETKLFCGLVVNDGERECHSWKILKDKMENIKNLN